MRQREVTCPFCDAEIPLDGDEKEGEEIYCSYCHMKLILERREKKLEAVEEEE
ncbi:MAG: hypothetical protein JRI46_01710 [Deltaproteobacteria bacterium]|nr:hypothetical protein [Deltaproteobacteria bacterium]